MIFLPSAPKDMFYITAVVIKLKLCEIPEAQLLTLFISDEI